MERVDRDPGYVACRQSKHEFRDAIPEQEVRCHHSDQGDGDDGPEGNPPSLRHPAPPRNPECHEPAEHESRAREELPHPLGIPKGTLLECSVRSVRALPCGTPVPQPIRGLSPQNRTKGGALPRIFSTCDPHVRRRSVGQAAALIACRQDVYTIRRKRRMGSTGFEPIPVWVHCNQRQALRGLSARAWRRSSRKRFGKDFCRPIGPRCETSCFPLFLPQLPDRYLKGGPATDRTAAAIASMNPGSVLGESVRSRCTPRSAAKALASMSTS